MRKNKNLRNAEEIYSNSLLQIIMIDLISEEIEELKIGGNIASVNNSNYLWELVEEMKKEKYIHMEDIEIYEENMNIEFLRKHFKTNSVFQFRYRHLINNDYRFVSVQMIKCNNFNSKFQNVYLYVSDIDDVQAIEYELINQLKEVSNEAKEANISKSVFLSKMSHDIRNPLNVVLGMTTLCKQYINNTDTLLDYLNKIDNSTEYLLNLINDTLEVSRIENNKIRLKYSHFNIVEIINSIIEGMKIIFADQTINFNHDIINPVVIADKGRIQQIIYNILSNSCKYTLDKKHPVNIFIKEERIEDDISNYIISIEDNGIGMDEYTLKNLFIPYERGERVNKIEGTGLGMIIVKSLIELMDGNINVNSVEGKGSNFIINIPFRHTIDSYEYDLDVNVLKDKHILVVEDYEINQLILGEFLKYANISFDCANNGLEAVNLVEKNSYDAILMDIQMPEMDGYDATLKIRENNNDIPIIAISADAFIEDIEKMKSYGMNDHVSKPIERDKLFSVLTKFFI